MFASQTCHASRNEPEWFATTSKEEPSSSPFASSKDRRSPIKTTEILIKQLGLEGLDLEVDREPLEVCG